MGALAGVKEGDRLCVTFGSGFGSNTVLCSSRHHVGSARMRQQSLPILREGTM
jgi:hypothetical protein